MFEDFFIQYANKQFKDDPDNLSELLELILKYANYITNSENKSSIIVGAENIVELIAHSIDKLEWLCSEVISFAEMNDIKAADEYRRELIAREDGFIGEMWGYFIDCAFEAVYGYGDGFCEGNWKEFENGDGCIVFYGLDLKEVLSKNGIDHFVRLNCIECRQLNFINILSELVQGEKYKDMLRFSVVDEKLIKDFYMEKHCPYSIGDKIRNREPNDFGAFVDVIEQ